MSSRLKIELNGQQIQEIQLNENKTYTGGRGQDCEIILDADQSISRHHFKIEFQSSLWRVENISKYGELLHGNEPFTSIDLEEDISFHIPPYSFHFSKEIEAPSADEEKALTVPEPETSPVVDTQDDFAGDNEMTCVGPLELVPHLRFVDGNDATIKIIRLEGDTWIAGRDEKCAILIEDKKVSRRQFEIKKRDDRYFIRDLGSVNGTLLNNQKISSENNTPLSSGSVISILHHKMHFEVKDSFFSDKVEQIQPALRTSPQPMIPVPYPQQHSHDMVLSENTLPIESDDPEVQETHQLPALTLSDLHPSQWKQLQVKERLQNIDYQKHKFRLTLIALIFVILMASLFGGDNSQKEKVANANSGDPFYQLTTEKQGLIKHSLQLANNLYMQGKYELAIAEIEKIHREIPEYQNSKEIEKHSLDALEVIKKQEQIKLAEDKERERQQRVAEVIAQCRVQMAQIQTSAEMNECLSEAQQLDSPDNTEIQALIMEVQSREEEKARKIAEAKELKNNVLKGQRLFKKAVALHDQGKFLSARKAYNRFLRSGLPDPKGLKILARRKIASIEKSISGRIREIINSSDSAAANGQFKKALEILDQSQEVEPQNQIVAQKRETIEKSLEKKMQELYQESVLEEALGKVDKAFSLWREIIRQDHKKGKYYKKAFIKLTKYGENP